MATLQPPPFDEATDTEPPLVPPAFDEAEDTEAPLTPPAFDEAQETEPPYIPEPPKSLVEGDELKYPEGLGYRRDLIGPPAPPSAPPEATPRYDQAAKILSYTTFGGPGLAPYVEKVLKSNQVRELAGGLAGVGIDASGGTAGFVERMAQGTDPRDVARWEAEILEIGKKPRPLDKPVSEYTPEDVEWVNRQANSGGFRTEEEENRITWLKGLVGDARERMAKMEWIAGPARDFQEQARLAAEDSRTFFGQDPARQDEFLSKLARGAGSLPLYIAASMAGGPVASMIVGAMQSAQNEYNSAVANGHPEMAQDAFDKGLFIGLTEGVGIGGGMSAAASGFRKKAFSILQQAAREGGQEWAQQTMSNLNANKWTGYDPSRGTFEGSGESALIGSILGASVAGVSQIPNAPSGRTDMDSAQSDLERAVEEFNAKKAEAIAASEALNQQAVAAAPVLPAAAAEAAKLAAVVEEQARTATPPSLNDEATPAAKEEPGRVFGFPAATDPAPVELSEEGLSALEAAVADEPVVTPAVAEAAEPAAAPVNVADLETPDLETRLAGLRQQIDDSWAKRQFPPDDVLRAYQQARAELRSRTNLQNAGAPSEADTPDTTVQPEATPAAVPPTTTAQPTASPAPSLASTYAQNSANALNLTQGMKIGDESLHNWGRRQLASNPSKTAFAVALQKALPGFDYSVAKDLAIALQTTESAADIVADTKATVARTTERIDRALGREVAPASTPAAPAPEVPAAPDARRARLLEEYFHGTEKEIGDSLSVGAGKNQSRFLHEEGIWFAPNMGKDFESSWPSDATRYAGERGTIVKAKLDIKNPYFGDVHDIVSDKISAKWLKDNGYDAFIDDISGSGMVVVLDPSQITETGRVSVKGGRIESPDSRASTSEAQPERPISEDRLGALEAELADEATPEQAAAQTPPPVPPKSAATAAPEPDGEPAQPAPSPAESSEPSPTGIRNAIVDRQRVARGLPERMAPLRRTFGRIWEQAMAMVDAHPNAGAVLVKGLLEDPRAMEDWEAALLAHEQVTRQNEFDNAVEAVNSNPENAEAKARLAAARNAVQEVYDAGQLSGTKTGQALAARKLLVNEDYSLAKMEATWRAEVNGGKPLSEEQSKLIKDLWERIDKSEAKLKELQEKQAGEEAQRIFDLMLAESNKEKKARKSVLSSTISILESEEKKSRAWIRKSLTNASALVDPSVVYHVGIIGAAKIARGIRDFSAWSQAMIKDVGEWLQPDLNAAWEKSNQFYNELEKAQAAKAAKGKKSSTSAAATTSAPATPEQVLANDKAGALDPRLVFDLARAHVNQGVEGMDAVMKAVHADLLPNHPDLTEREVRDAFSGYGKVTYPSKEEDLTKLREYRTLARLTSQLEDAERRLKPLKTGPQRDKASQQVRDLTKQVKETMRRMGIETTTSEQQLRTSLDAVKTRLRNQIEDLEKQIATRTKPEGKTPVPYDDEATALRTERDRLAGIAEEIFGKPELTDEQRIAAATKALDRAIAEEDALLKAGILKRPKKDSKTPVTAELEAKRAMLDSMRDLRRELADAAEPKTSPEERALQAALKTARKSIERFDQMLKTGKLTPEERASKFTPTDELEALWNERNALRDLVSELRTAARPKQSPEEGARKAALKALDKRIADLDRRLREGDFTKPVRAEGKAAQFADVQNRRAEAKALADLYRTMEKAQQPKRSEDEIRLGRDKKMIAQRTAELERRVREGDYAPRPKKDPVMDDEKKALLLENHKAKQAFQQGLLDEKLKNRTGVEKARDATIELFHTIRAILTGGELSGLLRQGKFSVASHPLLTAKGALPAMLRAGWSEANELDEMKQIKERENFPLYKSSGLAIHDSTDFTAAQLEGNYRSRWANKIPLIAGSGRAYSVFLARLRADVFDALKAKFEGRYGTMTSEQMKNIAQFVNEQTGSGGLGIHGQKAIGLLNAIYFAPKFVMSRAQMLVGHSLWSKGSDSKTRRLIVEEYARIGAGLALMYMLYVAALDDDDWDWINPFGGIEKDPRSAAFGKIKTGKSWIDPLAGEAQIANLMARSATGETKDYKGKVKSLIRDEKPMPFGARNMKDVLFDFNRSKMSPVAGMALDEILREGYRGEALTLTSRASRLAPITYKQIFDTMTKEEQVPRGAALSVLGFLGEGIRTDDDIKR